MHILFWGSSKWNLTEPNWAVQVGLRQVNRAGLSTLHLFCVDAGCQGARCPAEAQLSFTTGANGQQRCKSHSTAVTARCRWQMKHSTCVLWTLAQSAVPALGAAGIKPPKASDWHISRAEETLSHFLLFMSCYFCSLKPSFYFQCQGTLPSPLLGLKQDSFWNFILTPSQTPRLNIYFYESVLLQWYDWCHII